MNESRRALCGAVNCKFTIGIDFGDDGFKQFGVDSMAHDSEDGLYHGRRNATFLVVIEAVEHFAQHYKQNKRKTKIISPWNPGDLRNPAGTY